MLRPLTPTLPAMTDPDGGGDGGGGGLAPAYLVTGDDDHLIHRALEDLLAHLRRAAPDLDVEHVDAAGADGLPEMRTASLFGGRRCVVLRGAATLPGALGEQVSDYLDDPAPEATLVIVSRGTGRIRRVAKRVGEIGERTDARTPPPWKSDAWEAIVADELRRHGRDADRAALAALLERAGTDPTTIASKCAQVAAATGPDEAVTAEHVERITEGHGNRGGFAIADAVAERDPAAAIVALRGALEAGEAPLAILGAITYRMRQLLQVRGGASPREAGMSAGMHRRTERLARAFGPGELAWCHDRTARADLDLKSSDLPADLLLEVAVLELATSRDVGAPWNPLAASTG